MPGLRLTLLLVVVLIPIPSSVTAAAEFALVQKVIDDKAILIRSDGTTYLIEKGVGCLSLWRYEGKQVLIDSPGLFLGVGSRLLIPDADQECRIWSAEEIETIPQRPARATPSVPDINPREAEFDLYDSRGRPAAYFDLSDGLTLYLWSGKPVAYLDGDSVVGFNGKRLGWYRNGVLYDQDGNVVAAPAAAFKTPVPPPPPRGLKELKPLKGLKGLKPLKPLFSLSWSELPAQVFLLQGVD